MTKLEIIVFFLFVIPFTVVTLYPFQLYEQKEETTQEFVFRSLRASGFEPDLTNEMYFYNKKTKHITIREIVLK